MPTSPIRPTTKTAIDLARTLIAQARFGALAVAHPDTGLPYVTRIAVGTTPNGHPLSLISDLSMHTRALRANPECALLIGEPEDKGDPLTHPRLTLMAKARFVPRGTEQAKEIRAHYLNTHPKSKLYIDFADFNFVVFDLHSGDLNGGFGKAFQLTASDILGQ